VDSFRVLLQLQDNLNMWFIFLTRITQICFLYCTFIKLKVKNKVKYKYVELKRNYYTSKPGSFISASFIKIYFVVKLTFLGFLFRRRLTFAVQIHETPLTSQVKEKMGSTTTQFIVLCSVVGMLLTSSLQHVL
jgi:hypothetical protein